MLGLESAIISTSAKRNAMQNTPVTIHIPTPIYQRAQKMAQAQKKDVSEILAASIQLDPPPYTWTEGNLSPPKSASHLLSGEFVRGRGEGRGSNSGGIITPIG